MQKRTFTATLNLPAGTNAGTYEQKAVLDSQYDRANGLVVYRNQTGGLETFQLGLRSNSEVYAQPTNIKYFEADASCPKAQRLTPFYILCDKTDVIFQLVLPETLTEDLSVDVVFELERADRGR